MPTINNAIVDTLRSQPVVRKSEYRGNTQWIPVDLTGLTENDILVFTEVLPPNTKAVELTIRPLSINAGGLMSIGYTGDVTGIREEIDVSSETSILLNNTDVSSKQILGEVTSAVPASGFSGYILVVTDE
jgi:hypothetical protein